jgi:hypothetical protein
LPRHEEGKPAPQFPQAEIYRVPLALFKADHFFYNAWVQTDDGTLKYDELKTHRRGAKIVWRSKTPDTSRMCGEMIYLEDSH